MTISILNTDGMTIVKMESNMVYQNEKSPNFKNIKRKVK